MIRPAPLSDLNDNPNDLTVLSIVPLATCDAQYLFELVEHSLKLADSGEQLANGPLPWVHLIGRYIPQYRSDARSLHSSRGNRRFDQSRSGRHEHSIGGSAIQKTLHRCQAHAQHTQIGWYRTARHGLAAGSGRGGSPARSNNKRAPLIASTISGDSPSVRARRSRSAKRVPIPSAGRWFRPAGKSSNRSISSNMIERGKAVSVGVFMRLTPCILICAGCLMSSRRAPSKVGAEPVQISFLHA